MPEQFDIFVSYAGKDAARVQLIVDALEAEGWKVFWDRELVAGQSWEESIGIHLDSVPVVMPVWSNLSVGSRYVKSEANRAQRRGVLVPVTIDPNVEPPFGLEHIHSSNLVEWLAEGGGALPPRLKSSITLKLNNKQASLPAAAVSEPAGVSSQGAGSQTTGGVTDRSVREAAVRRRPTFAHPFVAGQGAGLALTAFALAFGRYVGWQDFLAIVAGGGFSMCCCWYWPTFNGRAWALMAISLGANPYIWLNVWSMVREPGGSAYCWEDCEFRLLAIIVAILIACLAGLIWREVNRRYVITVRERKPS